jgi:hypothetical protein
MKNIRRFTFSLAALLMVGGLAMVSPASARDGSDDSSTNTTTSSSKGSDDSTAEPTSSHETADSVEVHNLTTKLRQQGETELETHKQDVKQHTEAEREKSCTARKNNLTKRMANAVSWANKHKGVIDSAYTRVKAFHDSKNLNVPDYSTLTAAVDTAQANAQTSIDALSALNVNVDCTSQTVASSVSAFQQAVKSTRDSLKAYRAELVKLIVAMKGASTATTEDHSSTNSSDQ